VPWSNCGLHYKPMTIINDDSRVVNNLEASLTDDARVIIYDHHMFIVQATGLNCQQHFCPKSCFESLFKKIGLNCDVTVFLLLNRP
jgi:hypothetical protein